MKFDSFCFKKELSRFSNTPQTNTRTNAILSRNMNASYWTMRSRLLSQADSIKRRASQTTQCGSTESEQTSTFGGGTLSNKSPSYVQFKALLQNPFNKSVKNGKPYWILEIWHMQFQLQIFWEKLRMKKKEPRENRFFLNFSLTKDLSII